MLLKFGWNEISLPQVNGFALHGIVTNNEAHLIPQKEWHSRCILYCRSTSGPFITDRLRAGFYLGMKMDFCFFDNSGIWKSRGRIPSEGAFYLDIEAVFAKLQSKKPYKPEQLWVGGFCGGEPVAAYLKSKLHAEGINFFAEQSFSNFRRDFISAQPLARFMATPLLRSLQSRDFPSTLLDRPQECGFNVEELWRDLNLSKRGKIVLIHASNDERLSQAVKDRYAQLAEKVNQTVVRIYFTSPAGVDAHSDDFFKYTQARTLFVKAVFS